jgi:hypothetical protein
MKASFFIAMRTLDCDDATSSLKAIELEPEKD